MPKKYRKRPVIIEAVQFTGSNFKEIEKFCPQVVLNGIDEEGGIYDRANPLISTDEGDMLCTPNDWIIKGVKGEFYPCKPDVFEMTYEEYLED